MDSIVNEFEIVREQRLLKSVQNACQRSQSHHTKVKRLESRFAIFRLISTIALLAIEVAIAQQEKSSFLTVLFLVFLFLVYSLVCSLIHKRHF